VAVGFVIPNQVGRQCHRLLERSSTPATAAPWTPDICRQPPPQAAWTAVEYVMG
jgi:hypothetical protein